MTKKIEIASNNGISLNLLRRTNDSGLFAAAYVINDHGDLKNYIIDASQGWETMRHDYERAARDYNELVPDCYSIPRGRFATLPSQGKAYFTQI